MKSNRTKQAYLKGKFIWKLDFYLKPFNEPLFLKHFTCTSINKTFDNIKLNMNN